MLEWKETYNGHSKEAMAGKFRLSIWYDSLAAKGQPTGYRFSVEGKRSVLLFKSPEEAKAACIKAARRLFSEALQAIE